MERSLLKSTADVKAYELCTLECGLEVLLISSLALSCDGSNSTLAAAAMGVQVGSYSDPPHAGTLHICCILNTSYPCNVSV